MKPPDLEILKQVIEHHEGIDVDFKQKQYAIGKKYPVKAQDESKAKLIKDLLAFANTEHTGMAYIIIGVDKPNGQPIAITGLSDDERLDDATFQQIVEKITNHHLRFQYSNVEYEGKWLGVFEIHTDQNVPLCPKHDYGILRAGQIYVRRGSSNVVVMPDEYLDYHTRRLNSDIRGVVDRWLRIFQSHGIAKTQIPKILRGSNVELAHLNDPLSIAHILTEEIKDATCQAFNISPQWLDGQSDQIHLLISCSAEMSEIIDAMTALCVSCQHVTLLCWRPTLEMDVHKQTRAGLILIGENSFGEYLTVRKYVPISGFTYWYDPYESWWYPVLAVRAAMQLGLNIKGEVRPIEAIEASESGVHFIKDVLARYRYSRHWHPEDMVIYPHRYKVDPAILRFDAFRKKLDAAARGLGNIDSPWKSLPNE